MPQEKRRVKSVKEGERQRENERAIEQEREQSKFRESGRIVWGERVPVICVMI